MTKPKKAKLYTWGASTLINAELPNVLKNAMSASGWTVFDIYELVRDSIRKDNARAKKAKDPKP